MASIQINMYLLAASGSNKSWTTPSLTLEAFLAAVSLAGVCIQVFFVALVEAVLSFGTVIVVCREKLSTQ